MPYEQSEGFSAQGATLEVCLYSESPIVWKEVGEIKGWTPSAEWRTADATNLKSTSIEDVPVMYDAGAVDTRVNRVGTNEGQELLQECVLAAQNPLLRIRFTLPPNERIGQTTVGDRWITTGYCLKYDVIAESAKIVEDALKLRMQKRAVFEAGS